MTINNPELFMAGIWDWSILDGCFGDTKITPTDIDGCVERFGHVLYLETKQLGVEIPLAQRILFASLVKKGDSVLVIWGAKNQPQAYQVFSPLYPPPEGMMIASGDLDGLRKTVCNWFAWANKP